MKAVLCLVQRRRLDLIDRRLELAARRVNPLLASQGELDADLVRQVLHDVLNDLAAMKAQLDLMDDGQDDARKRLRGLCARAGVTLDPWQERLALSYLEAPTT